MDILLPYICKNHESSETGLSGIHYAPASPLSAPENRNEPGRFHYDFCLLLLLNPLCISVESEELCPRNTDSHLM